MIYSRNEMRAAIDEYVLNDRHRMLLQLKLVEGMTYEAAAEAAHYSTQHAKRLCAKWKPVLLRLL